MLKNRGRIAQRKQEVKKLAIVSLEPNKSEFKKIEADNSYKESPKGLKPKVHIRGFSGNSRILHLNPWNKNWANLSLSFKKRVMGIPLISDCLISGERKTNIRNEENKRSQIKTPELTNKVRSRPNQLRGTLLLSSLGSKPPTATTQYSRKYSPQKQRIEEDILHFQQQNTKEKQQNQNHPQNQNQNQTQIQKSKPKTKDSPKPHQPFQNQNIFKKPKKPKSRAGLHGTQRTVSLSNWQRPSDSLWGKSAKEQDLSATVRKLSSPGMEQMKQEIDCIIEKCAHLGTHSVYNTCVRPTTMEPLFKAYNSDAELTFTNFQRRMAPSKTSVFGRTIHRAYNTNMGNRGNMGNMGKENEDNILYSKKSFKNLLQNDSMRYYDNPGQVRKEYLEWKMRGTMVCSQRYKFRSNNYTFLY